MKRFLLLSYFLFFIFHFSFSQSVGVGTNSPNSNAILDIQSTSKGVLFPRMTTAQRNAIANPPDGLHVFNTEERCINIYDSVNKIWNCYCADCQTIVINITSNACEVDFYNSYAKNTTQARKYVVNIPAGVVISGCNPGDTALTFINMPGNAEITINNYGTIAGAGGAGGVAAINTGCQPFSRAAFPGQNGGAAIATKAGVLVKVNNYGIVAGGGGGGGGSTGSSATAGFGGGGGGGAGNVVGPGGAGGGVFVTSPIVGCVGAISTMGQPGSMGQATTGGPGGPGTSGGLAGGNGGARGQAGLNGATFSGGTVPGGLGGKAIDGGAGNTITNLSGGQSFGTIN